MGHRPWTAIPAQRSSAAVLKVKLWLVLGVLALGFVMGPIALVIALSHRGGPAASSPPSTVGSTASALAQIAASEYIAGQPYTIPVAAGMNPDHGAPQGSQPLPNATLTYAGASPHAPLDGIQFSIQKFLVTSGSSIYRLDLLMESTPQGPVLGAQPGLLPYVPAPSGTDQRLDFSNDPGALQATPSNLQEQINRWATAYASGDSQTLALLANHPGNYSALSGFTVASQPRILSVVQTSGGNLIVRISLLLSPNNAHGFQSTTELDLLVRTGSGIPEIVAWGPPGDEPLAPYSNVVS
jgi:hypothetical protein